jgi:hypothetical protein
MLATIQHRTFCLLVKNIQIRIYKSINLPVVCMGVKLGL